VDTSRILQGSKVKMSDDPRLKESTKPVWKMSPIERSVESLRRRALLMEYLIERNIKFRTESTTLIVETSMNNYFIDFADDDPRFITIQTVYEISDAIEVCRIAAMEASASSFGAKAIISTIEPGFRLRFIAQIVAIDLNSFLTSIGIYQAQVEDCRERFLVQLNKLIAA
jgi:hypothetical protein